MFEEFSPLAKNYVMPDKSYTTRTQLKPQNTQYYHMGSVEFLLSPLLGLCWLKQKLKQNKI